MTDKSKAEQGTASEFNLKHRVTGAAVLLFIGALVIPWLLGPPSEASKHAGVTDNASTPDARAASEIEKELLENNGVSEPEPEETVYISKITPLNGQPEAEPVAEKAVDVETAKETKNTDKPKQAPDVAKLEAEASKKEQAKKSAEDAKRKAREKDEADKKAKAEKLAQEKREKELQAALAAEAKSDNASQVAKAEPKVDVGWVVQVGLYLEKKGADSKLSALKKQGFKASSTVVDTNRGPKTGTRVWLGPFEKRAQAESENKKLKQQTGKDGFIRVYP